MWKLILGIFFVLLYFVLAFSRNDWLVQLWWLGWGIFFLVWYFRSRAKT